MQLFDVPIVLRTRGDGKFDATALIVATIACVNDRIVAFYGLQNLGFTTTHGRFIRVTNSSDRTLSADSLLKLERCIKADILRIYEGRAPKPSEYQTLWVHHTFDGMVALLEPAAVSSQRECYELAGRIGLCFYNPKLFLLIRQLTTDMYLANLLQSMGVVMLGDLVTLPEQTLEKISSYLEELIRMAKQQDLKLMSNYPTWIAATKLTMASRFSHFDYAKPV